MSVFDTDGVAVITGGASGFGLEIARRLVAQGMAVVLLDVSEAELKAAEEALHAASSAKVLALKCDVTKFDDCVAANEAVRSYFTGRRISMLFNNAGISGRTGQKILEGEPENWPPVFNVNVFGAMHIIKAFVPALIEDGPLPSGKKTFFVTTSSVVGLLNLEPGAYNVSKMAVTAICEQLAIELESLEEEAAHISPHSLHPTVAATGFLSFRDADGSSSIGNKLQKGFAKMGATTATEVIDALLAGLERGSHYIIVDHPADLPTTEQIRERVDDQIAGRRPRAPGKLGMFLKATDPEAFAARMQGRVPGARPGTKSRL